MRDRVVAVISRVLNVPVAELNNTSSPDTIKNWDSLKHMALILALEEELQVAFSDDEIVTMLTVGGIANAVDKKNS